MSPTTIGVSDIAVEIDGVTLLRIREQIHVCVKIEFAFEHKAVDAGARKELARRVVSAGPGNLS